MDSLVGELAVSLWSQAVLAYAGRAVCFCAAQSAAFQGRPCTVACSISSSWNGRKYGLR